MIPHSALFTVARHRSRVPGRSGYYDAGGEQARGERGILVQSTAHIRELVERFPDLGERSHASHAARLIQLISSMGGATVLGSSGGTAG